MSVEEWLDQQTQQQQQSMRLPTPATTQLPAPLASKVAPSSGPQQQQQQQQQSRSPSPLSPPPPTPPRDPVLDLFEDSDDAAPSTRPQKNPPARQRDSLCGCNPPFHKDTCPLEPKRPLPPAPKLTQKRPPTPGPSRGASKRRRTVVSDDDNNNNNNNSDDDDDNDNTADVDKMLDPRASITVDHSRHRPSTQVDPPAEQTAVRTALINFLMCV